MPVLRLSSGKPLISLTVDTDELSGEGALLGKSVSDLQSNITVGNGAITGTLKYVTGYTGFSGDPAEQEGNYLALHSSSTNAEAVLSVERTGGDHPGEKPLDDDGICIFRIKNTDQVIKVKAKVGNDVTIKTFTLTGLTLEDE